jgi:hypothetical protein
LALPENAKPHPGYEDGEVIHFHRHPGEPTEITLRRGSRGFDSHMRTKLAPGDTVRIIKVGRKPTAEEIKAAKDRRDKNRTTT